MRSRGNSTQLAAGLAAVALIACAAPAGAQARTAAGCVYLPAEHILAVTVKLTKPEIPADATSAEAKELRAEREGQGFVVRDQAGAIQVFGGPEATPVGCAGGAPTVFNTDYVLARRATNVKRPELAIDMRRGILGPGFTDEKDKTSEVEVFASLGRRSSVVVTGTSVSDHVTVGPSDGQDVVNWDANEAVRDPDVFAPAGSVILYGGAGADILEAAGVAEASGASLVGGGGTDVLSGTANTDLLQGDGGSDVISAGDSSDLIFGHDGAEDGIDCGGGDDTFVVVDPSDQLAGCEEYTFEDPLAGLNEIAARPLASAPSAERIRRFAAAANLIASLRR